MSWLNRLSGAITGLALGAFDTIVFVLLGIEFSLGTTDVTWLVVGSFTSSLVLLGFLLGWTAELRRKERVASVELAAAQTRIAQAEKLATLGQLASAVAHEVKNPLAIIRSSVQNLAETLPVDDAKESSDFILEEIDRLGRVTDSLVAFARPVRVNKERVAGMEILDHTARLAEQMLVPKSIALTRAVTDVGFVEADRDLVCQVLLGLLGNAAEVTPSGGTIHLEAVADGEQIQMAVSDGGPGVPSELADKIFEPFFTTRTGGSGLGLAVAKQIVAAHDGEIVVEPAEGGGARFVIRLRRAA